MILQTIPKTLEKYQHLIDFISDEREDKNGYFVYLKTGFICPDMECGTIHESTLKACAEQLKTVHKAQEQPQKAESPETIAQQVQASVQDAEGFSLQVVGDSYRMQYGTIHVDMLIQHTGPERLRVHYIGFVDNIRKSTQLVEAHTKGVQAAKRLWIGQYMENAHKSACRHGYYTGTDAYTVFVEAYTEALPHVLTDHKGRIVRITSRVNK